MASLVLLQDLLGDSDAVACKVTILEETKYTLMLGRGIPVFSRFAACERCLISRGSVYSHTGQEVSRSKGSLRNIQSSFREFVWLFL